MDFQRPRNTLKSTSTVSSILSIPRQQRPSRKSAGVFLLLTSWQTQGHCTSSSPGRTLHSQREKLKWMGWVQGWGCPPWIIPKQHLNSLLGVSYQKWTHLTPIRSLDFKDYSNERIKNRNNKERERKEGKSEPSSEHSKPHLKQGVC